MPLDDNRLLCLSMLALVVCLIPWGPCETKRECEVLVVFDMYGDEQNIHLHLPFK